MLNFITQSGGPRLAGLGIAVLATGMAHNASGAVMTLDYIRSFETGGELPTAGSGPYLRATLTDSGAGSTSVEFQLQVFNMTAVSGDHLKKWAFNLTGDQAKLDSLQSKANSFQALAGSVSAPFLEKPASNLGGGNPNFDFDFNFGNQNFQENESVKVTLQRSGNGLLSISDFLQASSTQQGWFYSGVFAAGDCSSYHLAGEIRPVPEAATVGFGSALLTGTVLLEVRRRQKRGPQPATLRRVVS